MKATTSRTVSFGPYTLDLRSGELRKHGIKIRLHQQPCRILLMLLSHPGEVVLREEIRQSLWPDDTVVEFDSASAPREVFAILHGPGRRFLYYHVDPTHVLWLAAEEFDRMQRKAGNSRLAVSVLPPVPPLIKACGNRNFKLTVTEPSELKVVPAL